MGLEEVDLSGHSFAPDCEMGCGSKATYIAQGCADRAPVLMCENCLQVGIHRVELYIHLYMRVNKRVLVCGECYRHILNLDTHLDVRKLGE